MLLANGLVQATDVDKSVTSTIQKPKLKLLPGYTMSPELKVL
jgi:hypothetical protein